jgi:VWFA-related protein
VSAGISGLALLFLFWMPLFAFSQDGASSTVPGTTLRTEVRLVLVDVVVLDPQGVPVNGLKVGDFQLKEDGTLQKITSVEEHTSAKADASPVQGQTQTADSTISASNKPLNKPAVWNVLLVDLFNTSKEDQAAMRRQLQQFAKQLPADEPVALVAMSSQIKVLSSFQDGAPAISRILDKNGLLSSNSSPPADVYERGEELMIQPTGDSAGPTPEILTNKARVDVERLGERAQTTLNNFSAIAMWLNRYPGRKNVYWLTAGFPLQGQPFGVIGYTQMNPTGPPNHGSQAIPMQSSTDKELESANVAIYPVDVRGVASPDINGVTSADTAGDFLAVGKLGDKSIDFKKDDQLKTAQQSEMLEIARATGGVASFNNDMAKTLRRDFDLNRGYYTVSYIPSNTTWNGAYRKISLALEQQGYRLFYREGYYAKDPDPQAAPTKDQFKMALSHGAPSEPGVLFWAKVNRSTDVANVEYAIDPQTIQYHPDPSGKLVADVDCAIVEYDSAGKAIQTSLIRLTSTVSPERLPALYVDLAHAKQTISLKPGAASLVLGVRDQSTGRFGKLEVALPLIALAPPAAVQPTPPDTTDGPAVAVTAAQPGATLPAAVEGPVLVLRPPPKPAGTEGRIRLDVVVTGKQGGPVSGLQLNDFAVFDDKMAQTILSFRAVDGTVQTADTQVQVILLLDLVNSSFEQASYAQQQIAKFLRQSGGRLRYPTSIAVFSGEGLRIQPRPSTDGNDMAEELIRTTTASRTIGPGSSGAGEIGRFQSSVRTLALIAENEGKLPGRKILIWTGPGWPMLAGPQYSSSSQDRKRYFDAIVDISTRLREARIALYGISTTNLTKGGASAGMPTPDALTISSAETAPQPSRSGPSISGALDSSSYKEFVRAVKSPQHADAGNLALQVFAVQSGGRVLEPSNDLASQIGNCLEDLSAFYSISFNPAQAKNADEYHDLKVQIARPGLTARANTGFYNQP